MKATADHEGQTFEIDTSGLESRMEKRLDEKLVQYKKELEKFREEGGFKKNQSKGVIESWRPSNSAKLIENLKHVKERDITEQWSIVIPALTTHEVAGHLRDYVFVTDEIKGKKGDIVQIPYVKDFDFFLATAVGGTFPGGLSLIGTAATILEEHGQYFDVPYEDIEKINGNLLDELNRTFAHAAVRAEDVGLTTRFSNIVTGSLTGGSVGLTGTRIKASATTCFSAAWIPDAIGKLLAAGKEVHPGDCILAMGATAYAGLLKELAASTATAFAYARGDVIQKGIVEDWLGVRIVVLGSAPFTNRYASPTSYECAFLMRPKRCMALAPKRDILIETDRIIKTRKLTITGSHTFGVECLDPSEAVRMITGTVASHV